MTTAATPSEFSPLTPASDADDAAPTPRPWPIVNREATVAELAAAEKFLEVVARTQQDGPCFRHLSILIGDAQSRRGVEA